MSELIHEPIPSTGAPRVDRMIARLIAENQLTITRRGVAYHLSGARYDLRVVDMSLVSRNDLLHYPKGRS